jgi:hypothetical protein
VKARTNSLAVELQRLVYQSQIVRSSIRDDLSRYESSPARAFTLDSSYKRLGKLSVKQDDLFRLALRCVEVEVFRAAHVMAWAAAVDFLHERLSADLARVKVEHPKWTLLSAEDLRNHSDYDVINVAYKIGALRKSESKAWHGLLNRRNECAHPEDVYPGLNEALGYIDEVFSRIATLQKRPWP